MTKLEILQKPLWSLADIKNFFGIKTTKASQMMQDAKRLSVSRYAPQKAKRDVILSLNKIDFEEEVRKQKYIEEIKQND